MKLGVIGCGNMATAIVGGIIEAKLIEPSGIIGADVSEAAVKKLKDTYGINGAADNREAVSKADTILLAVKPQYYQEMIGQIKDVVRPDQLIISIAAGRSIEAVESLFAPAKIKLVRLMPNTPALVGESMTAVCSNENVSEAELEEAMKLIRSFGKAEIVPESLFDTVTAVSGSSPAYVFMFIEAMADAAVLGGMPRAQAYEFAAQSVLGSAKLMLETGKHPGELKDMVTSPAGTTIEAVRVLEERGLRSAVIEGVEACRQKSEDMRRL